MEMNFATMCILVWLESDYGLYTSAKSFMQTYTGHNPYKMFVRHIGVAYGTTPNGVKIQSKILDYDILNQMMKELLE